MHKCKNRIKNVHVFFQGAVTQESVFSLNMTYANKRTKFKITAAIQKETPQVRACYSTNNGGKSMIRSAILPKKNIAR